MQPYRHTFLMKTTDEMLQLKRRRKAQSIGVFSIFNKILNIVSPTFARLIPNAHLPGLQNPRTRFYVACIQRMSASRARGMAYVRAREFRICFCLHTLEIKSCVHLLLLSCKTCQKESSTLPQFVFTSVPPSDSLIGFADNFRHI